jgi:hypothetical protein
MLYFRGGGQTRKMAATREEFIQFFEEKKKGIYLCPVCSSHVFAINVAEPPTSDITNAPPGMLVIPTTNVGTHTFYCLSCSNCGTTTFLHTNQFDAWKAAKKMKEGQ